MANSTTLYAWVDPLSVDKDLDHTWITDGFNLIAADQFAASEAACKDSL